MNRILLISILLLNFALFSQENDLDDQIDVGIELYGEGNKEKALKVWKKIEKKAKKNSSTYATTLRNIIYYYSEKGDESNLLGYYNKLINSNVNDKDKNNKLGDPFKNYRYHSTMSLASYYAKNGEFSKAIEYVEIADKDIKYETSSLTAFIFQKVDLAFWKYRLYNDLDNPEKAISVLIERAFEYNYKNMYPDWATRSESTSEQELSETIYSEIEKPEKLKSDIDSVIKNLTLDKTKDQIIFNLRGFEYKIELYQKIESQEKCEEYLKNSFFYNFLKAKINE
ncbi:hypothetical protein [Aquimarina celericrescens]|uniref:Tetratricopeptide repeat protein n=1 Tax=Aquimarina celericrescens TaxID=1964542 RepID=A0ABW5AT66_9FLAO|nr:hypothetical protein [Aquimarina celericrescens]